MYQSGWCLGVSWEAVGKPTVRQQRGKWVVRVDGIDTATGAKLARQLGTFTSQRAARNASSILRTVLRAALADAVDEGALRRSPANRVALPKDVVKAGLEREQPAWSEAEIGRFLAVADGHRWAAGFRLSVLYGLRRSEVLALRWDDIDLDVGTVRVDEGLIEVKGKPVWTEGKSARSRRTIPIDAVLRRRLRAHRAAQLEQRAKALVWEQSDLLFTTQTGAIVQARNFDRVLERLVRDAEVPRLNESRTAAHGGHGHGPPRQRSRRAPGDRRHPRPQPGDADARLRPHVARVIASGVRRRRPAISGL